MFVDVDRAVYLCRTEPDPSCALAKARGSLVSRYLALRRRLGTLRATAFTRHVDDLLNYDLELTGQASILAFRLHDKHPHHRPHRFGPRMTTAVLAGGQALDPDWRTDNALRLISPVRHASARVIHAETVTKFSAIHSP